MFWRKNLNSILIFWNETFFEVFKHYEFSFFFQYDLSFKRKTYEDVGSLRHFLTCLLLFPGRGPGKFRGLQFRSRYDGSLQIRTRIGRHHGQLCRETTEKTRQNQLLSWGKKKGQKVAQWVQNCKKMPLCFLYQSRPFDLWCWNFVTKFENILIFAPKCQ